ncbi:D-aminoacylase, partial [bacterium]|nr:D-aminoacylase [bacterium]
DYISDEEDVRDILRTPFSGVISDATYPSGGRVHPRVYGTFARLIEKYVVQERVLTL